MKVIEINHITKDYGNNKGVFDVNFSVEKGEVFGFLGPNGAGKTTTIRQLMGFIKPNKGTVKIYGMDCFSHADEIQKNLGYLPGEIAFMEDMTGIEFIRFIGKMKELKNFDYAKELMNFFELDANGKIRKMSKGMKQKIGIVCAFMQKPDVLILDEPTSGLDPLMQNKFVELILKEKQRGTTILMSSHIFEEIEHTCDKAAIIKEGRIVTIEEMEKLRQNRQKNIVVRFDSEESAARFSKSIPNSIQKGSSVSVDVAGDVDSFIKAVSVYTVKDIEIKTKSLEELFMHFYGGKNND